MKGNLCVCARACVCMFHQSHILIKLFICNACACVLLMPFYKIIFLLLKSIIDISIGILIYEFLGRTLFLARHLNLLYNKLRIDDLIRTLIWKINVQFQRLFMPRWYIFYREIYFYIYRSIYFMMQSMIVMQIMQLWLFLPSII